MPLTGPLTSAYSEVFQLKMPPHQSIESVGGTMTLARLYIFYALRAGLHRRSIFPDLRTRPVPSLTV